MSDTNHRRRPSEYVPNTSDMNVILATQVSSEEPTTVQSATLEDSTEQLTTKLSEIREANQVLKEISLELLETNKKLKEQLSKIEKENDLKYEKIKELESKIQTISERNNNLELSGRTMFNIHSKNKERCREIIEKLNKLKTELSTNFEKAEYDNIHFINYLIDLTLGDLKTIQF